MYDDEEIKLLVLLFMTLDEFVVEHKLMWLVYEYHLHIYNNQYYSSGIGVVFYNISSLSSSSLYILHIIEIMGSITIDVL